MTEKLRSVATVAGAGPLLVKCLKLLQQGGRCRHLLLLCRSVADFPPFIQVMACFPAHMVIC
jgi:hypothetical protein